MKESCKSRGGLSLFPLFECDEVLTFAANRWGPQGWVRKSGSIVAGGLGFSLLGKPAVAPGRCKSWGDCVRGENVFGKASRRGAETAEFFQLFLCASASLREAFSFGSAQDNRIVLYSGGGCELFFWPVCVERNWPQLGADFSMGWHCLACPAVGGLVGGWQASSGTRGEGAFTWICLDKVLTGSVENFIFERFEKNTTEDAEVHGENYLCLGGQKTLLCDPLCSLWFLKRTKRGGFLQSLADTLFGLLA